MIANEEHPYKNGSQDQQPNPDLIEGLDLSELNDRFRKATPTGDYGLISLTSADLEFIEHFKEALKEGDLDSFIQQQLFPGHKKELNYSNIYRAKMSDGNPVAENHLPENIEETKNKLILLREYLLELKEIPQFLKDLYLKKIEAKLHFCELPSKLATPEFTKHQYSEDSWRRIVDIDQSLKNGEMVFPYENQAWLVLNQPTLTDNLSLSTALDYWQFSDSEKKQLVFLTNIDQRNFLNSQETVQLIQVLLKRLNMENWQVVLSESTAMGVEGKAKRIKVPINRELRGDEIIYIIGHEIMHALRAENGSRWGIDLFQVGTVGYIDTEEGLTVNTEMILGAPFGHRRQKEMALRYVISAYLAKTKLDNGELTVKYSVQEIFNKLKETGMDEEIIAQNIWRALRGTSLRREIIEIEFDGQKIPMAETYIKDMCYFRGQSMIYEAFIGLVDFYGSDEKKQKLIAENRDYNQQVLMRIGLAKKLAEEKDYQLSYEDRKRIFKELQSLGEQALFDLIDMFAVGKLSFEEIVDMNPDLRKILDSKKESMISYRNIFKAN